MSGSVAAVLWYLLLGPSPTLCQTISETQLDARALALAGTIPTESGDARLLWWNPSALASPDTAWSLSVGVSRPFGLADLTTLGLALARTSPRSGFGVGLATFGNEMYRETALSAGGGVGLTRMMSVGVSVNLTDVTVAGSGRSAILAATWGAVLRAPRTFSASFVGSSLVAWSSGELLLTSRRRYTAALEYAASAPVRVLGTFLYERGHGWSHGVALAVQPHPWLSLYLGRVGGPSGFTGGCEVRMGFVRLAYGARLHPELDPTHALTVTLVR